MATEVKDEVFCCLYDGESVVLTCISTDITAEEVQKQSRRCKSPPSDKTLDSSFGSCSCDYGTTLVSVGSIVYCIGGISVVDENGSQVTMFDTNKTSLELVTCPSMNMGRTFPAVVVIDKKIYAFGGISDQSDDAIQTPWAECLDTNMPIHKQKWEPLTEPPLLLQNVFAIHYEDSTISVGSSGTCCMESYILIGCSSSHDAQLYGVNSGVWKIYSFGDTIDYASSIFEPVTVGCDKTMYWVCRRSIYAYDLVDNIVYMANIEDSALYDHKEGFDSLYMGPVLMHLKDNIFCCFTVYYLEQITTLRRHIVVECTKFRVTKEKEPKDEGSKSQTGVLHLHSVGYESYLSPALSGVLGVLPIKRGNYLKK